MRKYFFYFIGFFLLFTTIVACSNYFGSAMSDIKKNKITSSTVGNLEKAKTKDNKSIESYYQLARIYQYNQDLQNLDKAKEYYHYLISNINDANLKSQYEKLKEKQAVDRNSLERALKNVKDLIDTRTFNSYIKINTLDAYKEFITKYPQSNHITDAKNKAFEKACSINTIDYYKDYILKIPNHKTNEAKDKAYYLAVSINTLDVYKSFLSDFQDHRKDEIHEKAYKITEGLNTIKDYNIYISTFPYSKMNNSAISKRDYIIVSDFKKSISGKSLAIQIAEIDNFIYNNSDNVQIDLLTKYAISILPSINNTSEFQNNYNMLNKAPYKTSTISSLLNEYFSNSVLSVFNVDNDYKSILSGYSYNYANFKPVLEQRIQTYSTILSSYNLSLSTSNQIKKIKLNEEFVLKYFPLKQIVENMSSYNDSKHRENAAQIRALLKNSIYNDCDDWLAIKSFFENSTFSTNCSKCSGTGKIPETKCINCKGRGKLRCTAKFSVNRDRRTDGWGSTTVDAVNKNLQCRGGYIKYENYNVSPVIKIDEICTTCNGTGEVDCPKCEGWGVITECPACEGNGSFTKHYLDYN